MDTDQIVPESSNLVKTEGTAGETTGLFMRTSGSLGDVSVAPYATEGYEIEEEQKFLATRDLLVPFEFKGEHDEVEEEEEKVVPKSSNLVKTEGAGGETTGFILTSRGLGDLSVAPYATEGYETEEQKFLAARDPLFPFEFKREYEEEEEKEEAEKKGLGDLSVAPYATEGYETEEQKFLAARDPLFPFEFKREYEEEEEEEKEEAEKKATDGGDVLSMLTILPRTLLPKPSPIKAPLLPMTPRQSGVMYVMTPRQSIHSAVNVGLGDLSVAPYATEGYETEEQKFLAARDPLFHFEFKREYEEEEEEEEEEAEQKATDGGGFIDVNHSSEKSPSKAYTNKAPLLPMTPRQSGSNIHSAVNVERPEISGKLFPASYNHVLWKQVRDIIYFVCGKDTTDDTVVAAGIHCPNCPKKCSTLNKLKEHLQNSHTLSPLQRGNSFVHCE